MEVLPVDLTDVLMFLLAMIVVGIPVAGITARFALKPIAEAVTRMRESRSGGEQLELVEKRLSLLEQQLSGLESDVRRVEETAEFERRLGAGRLED